MSARPHQRSVHPKISSMPRKQSEATAHLQLYKMSVEKNRLHQELQNLKNREQQIEKRLAEIEEHSEKLLADIHESKSAADSAVNNNSSPSHSSTQQPQPSSPKSAFEFQEVYVDY